MVINEHVQFTYKQEVALALIRNENSLISPSSNPTLIPDHVFSELTPIFVIRNPVHAVPSNYVSLRQTSQVGIDGEDWKLVNGVPLQRRLFDHFQECNKGTSPLVVDGDDVIWRTDELRDSLSRALDLDPKGLSSVWEAVPQDERDENPIMRHFLQVIDDSTGIVRPSEQRPDSDLDAAYRKWTVEYGQDAADRLRATVDENMPHYLHMIKFKI